MTLSEPSLLLRRLLVFAGGESVYDESFHAGVNVIRGQNSSGKSTIADFIFYALGGELLRWKAEAAVCDRVVAEVALNGIPVTVSRDVAPVGRSRAMRIYWGAVDLALEHAEQGWQTFPYSRTGTSQSFSEVLMRAMGMPPVKAELATYLTMNQLLRLMYSDQISPMGRVFRDEDFDQDKKREAVGAYLLGYFDSRLHEAEIELRTARDSRQRVDGEIKQAAQLLGDEFVLPTFFHNRIEVLNRERDELLALIAREKEELRSSKASDEAKSDAAKLERELAAAGREVVGLLESVNRLNLEIEDSLEFIVVLQRQLSEIDESLVIRRSIADLPFLNCPSCGTRVHSHGDQRMCDLCKTERPLNERNAGLLRLKQELAMQLGESKQLQHDREAKLVETQAKLKATRRAQQEAQRKLLALSTDAPDELGYQVQQHYRRVGYIDRELEDMASRQKLAERLVRLREERTSLELRIRTLEEEIADHRKAAESNRVRAKSAVCNWTARLLEGDLPREDMFRLAAQSVDFDFARDRLSVGGRELFSASSTVVLKNSFHLGLLAASADIPSFRLPRFMLFDNIEDKGMEELRSWNFQRLMVQTSDSLKVEHQAIFTTSMIAPELEHERYVIGRAYSREHKSLQMRSIGSTTML